MCTKSNNRTISSFGNEFLGQTISLEGTLTREERTLAFKICSSLRGRYYEYHDVKYQPELRKWHLQEMNCEGESIENTSNTRISQNDPLSPTFFYISGQKKIFWDLVLSHKDGPMKKICENVLEGQETLSNLVYKDQVPVSLISFLIGEKGNLVQILMLREEENGEFRIYENQVFQIETKGEYKGEIIFFESEKLCADGLNSSRQKQFL